MPDDDRSQEGNVRRYSKSALNLLLIGVLAGTMALSACGKKGDPVRPGQEKTEEKKSS